MSAELRNRVLATGVPKVIEANSDIGVVAECHRSVFRQTYQASTEVKYVLLHRWISGGYQALSGRDQRRSAALPLDKGSQQNYRRGEKRAPSVRFYPLALLWQIL